MNTKKSLKKEKNKINILPKTEFFVRFVRRIRPDKQLQLHFRTDRIPTEFPVNSVGHNRTVPEFRRNSPHGSDGKTEQRTEQKTLKWLFVISKLLF